MGSLVFGIGTGDNNSLGNATVQTLDENENFTTIFNGAKLSESYIDSGTNLLAFNDSSIPPCTGELAGYSCPPSTLALSAQNIGINKAAKTVLFSVDNSETPFDNGAAAVAFNDLAGTGTSSSFAGGFPFFIGRSVFVALDGAATPGGSGSYVAY